MYLYICKCIYVCSLHLVPKCANTERTASGFNITRLLSSPCPRIRPSHDGSAAPWAAAGSMTAMTTSEKKRLDSMPQWLRAERTPTPAAMERWFWNCSDSEPGWDSLCAPDFFHEPIVNTSACIFEIQTRPKKEVRGVPGRDWNQGRAASSAAVTRARANSKVWTAARLPRALRALNLAVAL